MFFSNLRKKSDEEIMTLVQPGNRTALTELYRRYSTPLLRYFHRMLWKDHEKAQDFVQDLFLKIIQHGESFDAKMSFSTWIYSMAHNMCKNEYRKKAFRDAVHINHGAEIVRERVFEPDVSPDFNLNLENALATLDADDKHLFVLRFELDLPMEHIAVMLACPVGTVKSRIFNLKKKLAVQLSELNPLAKTVWK
jgi:RNA polymerase sigma-70 factor (ECF subfamily)